MKEFKGAARTLYKGFVRALYGTAVSVTVVMAMYAYVSIPGEGGYAAVADFILATATLGVALGLMYAIGGGNKKKGENEK